MRNLFARHALWYQQRMGVDIEMIHPSIAKIPVLDLPAGYGMRNWQEGDEWRWMDLIKNTFGDAVADWTQTHFLENYRTKPQFDPQGFFFIYALTDPTTPVATAFAWYHLEFPYHGQVHWVGVLPQHRGRGLARYLVTSVLEYHLEQGRSSAFLLAETGNHVAFALYHKMGFMTAKALAKSATRQSD